MLSLKVDFHKGCAMQCALEIIRVVGKTEYMAPVIFMLLVKYLWGFCQLLSTLTNNKLASLLVCILVTLNKWCQIENAVLQKVYSTWSDLSVDTLWQFSGSWYWKYFCVRKRKNEWMKMAVNLCISVKCLAIVLCAIIPCPILQVRLGSMTFIAVFVYHVWPLCILLLNLVLCPK